MKKLWLISAGLCITMASAQTTPNTQAQIVRYSKKIDSIVTAEKKKMNQELDVLEKNIANIPSENVQLKKTEIAKRYEESVNQKINAEKETLEKIIQLSVRDALIQGENFTTPNSITIPGASQPSLVEFKTSKQDAKDRLQTHNIALQLGYQSVTPNATSTDLLKNQSQIKPTLTSTSVLYLREKQLGKLTSATFIRYGFGWSGNRYTLVKPLVFRQDGNNLYTENFNSGVLRKTRLSTHYVEAPLEMHFVLNPKYLTENGEKILDMRKRQLRIGVGLYGRYLIGSSIQMKYENDESSKNIFQQKTRTGLNRAGLGAMFSVGYGGLNFFIKKDLTPTFAPEATLHDRYGLTFGMVLANINL